MQSKTERRDSRVYRSRTHPIPCVGRFPPFAPINTQPRQQIREPSTSFRPYRTCNWQAMHWAFFSSWPRYVIARETTRQRLVYSLKEREGRKACLERSCAVIESFYLAVRNNDISSLEKKNHVNDNAEVSSFQSPCPFNLRLFLFVNLLFNFSSVCRVLKSYFFFDF